MNSSELFMQAKDWNKIRGVVMIASMKSISIAVDMSDTDGHINAYEFTGYMLCSVTSLFGPWTSFENYLSLYKQTKWVSDTSKFSKL